MSRGKLASLGGVVAAAVLGASLPACAQPLLRNLTPFGDMRGAANPPVARYLAGQGASFILDRSVVAPEALLKFDDSPEVWVLQPSPAPRGDTIWRNDVGDPVLRVTRLGGVTLFTQRAPEGMPAALMGDAGDLQLPPFIPPETFLLRGAQAAFRSAQAAGHKMNFSTPRQVPLPWYAQFIDSFNVAADAIGRLGRERKAKAFLTKLESVQFVAGAKPDVTITKSEVTINGEVMTITIVPQKGFAGRPSSDRIVKVALKH